jgi:adenine-specific DNA-methyltransferase
MPTLNWIGKEAVVNHHHQVPFHLLKDVPDLACGEPGDGNLIVQGDNLVALKALLPYYAGQVKCIYIDPPYNTGNEGWAYNDNVNSPVIREWLGKVVGKEDETLDRHDRWLCMMFPRLALLRQFLRKDGVILVSIDDNALANLLHILEEIFGATNHLGTLVWEKGKKGDSKFFSENHEYIVVFALSKSLLVQRKVRWQKRKEGVDQVLEHYQSIRTELDENHTEIRVAMMKWYRLLKKDNPAKAHKHYNWSDTRGLYFAADFAGPDDGRENRPRYDIPHPITGKACKKPSTGWRWDEETTRAALAEDPPRIHFGLDESTIPCRKTYLFEVSREPFPTVFYKDGRAATLLVEEILGQGAFAFPKDVSVLSDLIGMISKPGDLVLDSFGGSGSTAHALLDLNRSTHDSEPRRFILVQQPYETEEQRLNNENICRDKTAKRVRRVAEGYKNAKGEEIEGLGGGFRYCELGEPLFDESGKIRETVSFADLARHVYFTETGEPLPRERVTKSPFIGECRGVGIYLLFNGILDDKSASGGNVLTRSVLAKLPKFDGQKVIYCAGCLLGKDRLQAERTLIRQTPYEIKVS